MTEQETKQWLELGLRFHGHVCGGMPMGFKAGVLAMETLGVPREPDSELIALVETGEHHLAGCWVDGIMLATGCTYGKGNIIKMFWGKWALTLVDKRSSRAVRVSMKPEVLENALESPFLRERFRGVLPSKVTPEFARAMFEGMAARPASEVFTASPVFSYTWAPPKTTFAVMRCERCGELTVKRHMRVAPDGKRVCIPCLRSAYDYPESLAMSRGADCLDWPLPPEA